MQYYALILLSMVALIYGESVEKSEPARIKKDVYDYSTPSSALSGKYGLYSSYPYSQYGSSGYPGYSSGYPGYSSSYYSGSGYGNYYNPGYQHGYTGYNQGYSGYPGAYSAYPYSGNQGYYRPYSSSYYTGYPSSGGYYSGYPQTGYNSYSSSPYSYAG